MTKEQMTAEIARLTAENTRMAAETSKSTAGPARRERDCACGCGEQTRGGVYKPGHDAKHHSALRHAGQAAHTLRGTVLAPIAPKAPKTVRLIPTALHLACIQAA